MHDARTLLEAGGLVPAATPTPPDLQVDAVGARVYRHPAIGGRTVVRLVPASLDEGSDTHLGTFGFVLAGHRPDLALQRRRELGFPQWTLVHEPPHAALVLGRLDAFRRARKLSASKPGHGRDAFVAIAATFERAAPSVLPTFWEEAGRVFVDLGNPKMAATCFDKARAAEARFGLPSDPSRTGEVFLEFALAGAVTVKSLQAWAKDLGASLGADEAYERFLALAVRRTLGGLPPWASFGKDLAQLAKAAGRDPVAERRRWTAEILGASSLDRASTAFWTEHADALVSLAAADPARSRALLERFPKGTAAAWDVVDEDLADAWLELLHRAGALERAWTDPEVDASRWLASLLAWAPTTFGPALPIARKVGERLAREGGKLVVGEDDDVGVDAIDLLLELGVPVEIEEGRWWDVRGWAAGEPVPPRFGLPAEHRPRDPAHLAAHPELGASLVEAAANVLGDEDFERATAGSPVMARVRREAVRARVAALDGTGLREAEEAVDQLVELSLQRLKDEPELWEALGRADLARALAGTWRAGLVAELGWPAFEAAVTELGAEDLVIGGPWPWTVLANARRAIVLGPDGQRLASLDLKLPGGAEPASVRWIGDQLLVGWTDGGEGQAAWSSRPRVPFPAEVPRWEHGPRMAARLADGAWFLGGRAFHVGDEAWPEERPFLHDGQGFWRVEGRSVVAVDPVTGQALPGRPPPSFCAGVDPSDLDEVDLRCSPGGEPMGRRPLPDGGAETLSGLAWKGSEAPDALVVLPGDPVPRALVESWNEVELFAPEGFAADAEEDDDERPRPPIDRAHLLVPRDPRGSGALRKADADRARAVMDAVRGAAEPEAEVARALPEVTDPRLRAAVARTAVRAVELEERLRAFLGGEGASALVAGSDAATPSSVCAAAGLAGPGSNWLDDVDLPAAMKGQAAFLAGADGPVPPATFDWASFGPTIRALGWAIASPGLEAGARRDLVAFLRAWLEVPPIELRRAEWSFPDLKSPFLRTTVEGGERHLQDAWTVVDEGGRWLVATDDTWSDEGPFDVRTWSTGAGTPPGATLSESAAVRLSSEEDRAWIAALLERAGSTPAPVPDAASVAAVSTATGLSAAASSLLLAGGPRFDDYGDDFLGAELRGLLGLKRRDAALGRSELQRLDREGLRAVLAEAAPEDPAALWVRDPADPAGAVQRLAAALVRRFGRRIPVPPELRAAAEKALGDEEALDLLAAPDTVPGLAADRACTLGEWGDVDVEGGEGVDTELLRRVVLAVPWILQQVPVADPLLAGIPRLVELVRARLSAPGLMLAAGSGFGSERKIRALFDAVAGRLEAREDGAKVRDAGALVARLEDGSLSVVVRPAQLDDAALGTLGRLADALDDDDLRVTHHVLGILRSGRLDACAARVADTPVPAGGHECDPAASVPRLVAEAAKELRVDGEAAALMLQLLALPSPTKKALMAWNGWTPKTYAAAAKALVDAGLVVEGKRARAGRDHFLPGPWEDGPPPFETWKASLYGVVGKRGDLVLPLGAMAADPPHVLFEQAWARWRAGDRPRFG